MNALTSSVICTIPSITAQSAARKAATRPLDTNFWGARSRFSLSLFQSAVFPGVKEVSSRTRSITSGLFGGSAPSTSEMSADSAIAMGPDDDKPAAGLEFFTFGAGCFWGPELAFQRIPGVVRTEVGYTQGTLHNPTYGDVCSGRTGHNEAVRVEYDPKEVSYEQLLEAFFSKHDPTTLNRQGGDVGTQYRSGLYFYKPEQEQAAKAMKEALEAKLGRKIVTEILPARKWYRAEEYHQQYLAKGGRFGLKQSPAKLCTDPIRCYG